MGAFVQLVYEMVALIPPGKVGTYGQIASIAGSPKASRAVAAAVKASPQNIPYHRVVSADGRVSAGSEAGALHRRQLLGVEGVTFLPDGRVDMDKHLWIGLR